MIKDCHAHRNWLVDLDGTLCEGKSYTPDECLNAVPIQKMIDKVNQLSRVDNIIIYTARQDHLIPATFQWLRRHNVTWHCFSNQKIPAIGKYVDDNNMSIEEFLNL